MNAQLGMGRVHPRVGSCWVRMCDRHANDRQLQMLSSSLSFICYWIPSHVKVYVEIVNTVDAYKLQTALDLIAAWAATWHLQVSVNKCNILHIGSVQCSIDYFIGDVELPNNKRCRDLGVIMTSEWSVSLNAYRPKRNYCQGSLSCKLYSTVFECKNVGLSVRAFLVYVRPIVEYCSVAWSPCSKQDIETIEKVQRRFTKRLKGLKCMSYKERLRCLDLHTLELRPSSRFVILLQNCVWFSRHRFFKFLWICPHH